MENNRDFLTTKEVCAKYGISPHTLHNWRRGYYFGKNKKVFYLRDHSNIPAFWNQPEMRWEYNPIKIAVWINRLSYRKEGELS